MNLPLKSALAAAILVAGAGYAAALDTIIITPEQRTVVREYVVRERIDPMPDVDYDITVGSIVPAQVQTRKLAIDEFGDQYEFVVTNRGTLVVDPATRQIVDVVE